MDLLKENIPNALSGFFSISYVPFIVPVLLNSLNIEHSIIWLATCLTIAIATYISSIIINKPVVAGPSIAGIAIISNRIIPNTNFNELIAIVLSSCILIALLTKLKVHNSLLKILNNQIKTGFKAGIGLMFFYSAIQMVQDKDKIFFIFLLTFFWLMKDKKIIISAICIAITFILNEDKSFALPDKITLQLLTPILHLNLIKNILILTSTIYIDSLLTINTLKEGSENKGLYFTSFSSIFSAITLGAPCAIYMESLILKNTPLKITSYIISVCFLILGILGSNIQIPSFVAASLLALLGIQIIILTEPKTWVTKKPNILCIAVVIGIFKSFLYGIFLGILLEYIKNNKYQLISTFWILAMGSIIAIINLG